MVGKNGTAMLGAGLLLAASGCFSPPPEAQARLEQVKAENADLDRALDRVEGRLLGGQEQVYLWQELAWRHRRVSALACENAAMHMKGMRRFLANQEAKSRHLRRRRVVSVRREAVSEAMPSRRSARSN